MRVASCWRSRSVGGLLRFALRLGSSLYVTNIDYLSRFVTSTGIGEIAYRRDMRIVLLAAVLAGCGGKPPPQPPKRPNTELIVGKYERHPPAGTTAAWFRADGSVTIAHEKGELDTKPLAVGTWKLDGDQLTLVYTKGEMCPAGVEGTYKIVLSRVGVHFTKVEDSCDRRAKMDGETWYRFQ